MTSRFDQVNLLLNHFNNYQDEVDSRKSVVKNFLQTLKGKINKRKNFVTKGSKFYKVGGSYEDSAVSPKADFDIAMVLSSPFTMDAFESVEVVAGVYKLRCTDDSEYLDEFVNPKGFLKVEELRNKIFNELISIIDVMATDGYAVKYRELDSTLTVTLKKSNESVKIDIAPQIAANVRFGDVPGWIDEDIPEPMANYINDNDVHILFNLSCPIDLQNESYNHLVVQPSFNLLEKESMLNSDIVRDAVRIAKSVCKYYNWMKEGLRSFQIKRIAMNLFDEIEDSNDSWDGYKLIMNLLIEMMIEDGEIDGFFIEDQIIICRGQDECNKLGVKIRKTVKKIHPTNILKLLGFQ